MDIKEVKGPVGFLRFWFQDAAPSKQEVFYVLALVALILELYAALFLAIGSPFLPPQGSAWAVIFIWAVAGTSGYLAEKLQVPSAMGMILSGMLLRNVGGGLAIAGLEASWSKQIRAAALAIIFLRSGLEIDLDVFKRVGNSAIRLLLVPGIIEAFFDGGIAIAIFGMPPLFAFALGFILKAVGPALVIQCMFEVQQKRLGTQESIPATVVAAASFDDAIAITGYTLFINLAVRGGGNTTWNVMHGPLSLLFGVLVGCAAGGLCAVTKLWNNSVKRSAVLLITSLAVKYFFDHYNFTSAGAIASLVMGLLAKELWKRGKPAIVSAESGSQMGRAVEKQVRWLWRFVMMPLLFGLVGASINLATIASGSIGKACAIVLAGLAVRMPCTYMVMYGSGFSAREKLFFALAWSPKATVQATLANLPTDAVNAAYPVGDPQHAAYSQWAEEALVTAVFCILLCAAIGTFAIRYFAPLLLSKAPEEGDDPTAHIVTGLSSSQTGTPKGSQIELTRMGEPRGSQAAVPPLPPPLALPDSNASPQRGFGSAGGPAPVAGGPASPQAPGTPKDTATEALRSAIQTLSSYLDSIEDAASEVERKAMTVDGGGACAERLQRSIFELRRKLQEGAEVSLGPSEVESAEDFFLATSLRHRSASGRSAGSMSAASMRARRQQAEMNASKTSSIV